MENDWVSYLGEKILAVTGINTLTGGPEYIRYAQTYGPDGANVGVPWSYDGSPTTSEYDFRSTAIHELGHALGLKHPEYDDATFPWASYDGDIPTMLKASAKLGEVHRRNLAQDDLSGGYWSNVRQYLPYPENGKVGFWKAANGTLEDCGSYICFTPTGYPSFMYIETRFTTDYPNQIDRVSPTLSLSWRTRPTSEVDIGGRIKVKVGTREVHSTQTGGDYEQPTIQAAPECSHYLDDGFSKCAASFTLGSHTVQDIIYYIYNESGGEIHVDKIRAKAEY